MLIAHLDAATPLNVQPDAALGKAKGSSAAAAEDASDTYSVPRAGRNPEPFYPFRTDRADSIPIEKRSNHTVSTEAVRGSNTDITNPPGASRRHEAGHTDSRGSCDISEARSSPNMALTLRKAPQDLEKGFKATDQYVDPLYSVFDEPHHRNTNRTETFTTEDLSSAPEYSTNFSSLPGSTPPDLSKVGIKPSRHPQNGSPELGGKGLWVELRENWMSLTRLEKTMFSFSLIVIVTTLVSAILAYHFHGSQRKTFARKIWVWGILILTLASGFMMGAARKSTGEVLLAMTLVVVLGIFVGGSGYLDALVYGTT
jgi:hypothetical protein